jgi:hypothetical protein
MCSYSIRFASAMVSHANVIAGVCLPHHVERSGYQKNYCRVRTIEKKNQKIKSQCTSIEGKVATTESRYKSVTKIRVVGLMRED